MAAAATPSPEMALPAADDKEDEDECRICRLPADADRPLRRPCGCRGSMRFVHDDCQLQWIARRRKLPRCEVCRRRISIRPLYAADALVRLPVSELMAGLPSKLIGLLLPLFFAVCVVREFVVPLTTCWAWRLALATDFARAHHLLSLRLPMASWTCIPASVALCMELARLVAPFSVAPFARWVARLVAQIQSQEPGLYEALQVLAIFAVEVSLVVLIVDMALACILCFLPFSLGRIILWSRSCLNLGNEDEINCYTSTASTLLIGYGFIFKVGATLAGLHTFYLYLRGKRLVIAIFYRSLHAIFFRGIVNPTTVANVSLNILNNVIVFPLFFGWSLGICTSKLFGATMSQRFRFLIASSFASAALHWLMEFSFLNLRRRLSRFLHKILGPGVATPFLDRNVSELFYTFYLKWLVDLFIDTIFIALVISVPIKIVDLLAPTVFPLEIPYFDHPARGTSVWQGPLNFTESLSGVIHTRYLIGKVVVYLEPLVERVMGYWFVTTGQPLGNNVAPKDQYGSSDDAKDDWRLAAVRTVSRAVVAWLAALIFNSAVLLLPISVGRALLFAIPQLLVADGLKSNDLFAVAVGLCIISTIIAACRDLSAHLISGETCLLALQRHLLLCIWSVVVPLLTGLLVDLSLTSPFFVGRDDEFPATSFFRTWLLGRIFKQLWIKCLVDKRWKAKLDRAKEDLSAGLGPMWRFFQDMCVPVVATLLAALVVPYVLARGVFPGLGYPTAVNSTVYRFAWSGGLGVCALCWLAKGLCVMLHDSIKEDRYAIGRRLEDVGDGS
ncbi:hypothetical protein VPH35_005302 [Triticum aestivum]|uniref:RING-CH-type domain-containing protein n=3 Tax=Triticum TaxID=4564 RepID=A0A9R0QKZ7_TRITD|nr:probable E3 ubiquitin ligase SUD1 [Triticum aestivum]VAH11539.1 unnamed protein product [Triticum turgidum subsp. durum]